MVRKQFALDYRLHVYRKMWPRRSSEHTLIHNSFPPRDTPKPPSLISACPEKALDSTTLGRTEHWGHTQNVATDPFGDPSLPFLFFLFYAFFAISHYSDCWLKGDKSVYGNQMQMFPTMYIHITYNARIFLSSHIGRSFFRQPFVCWCNVILSHIKSVM